MKAACVKPDRSLETREIATPNDPPADHLLVEIDSCAINHGDKTFLRNPPMALASGPREVWGASGVGRVIEIGAGVPEAYAGKHVAIYRSLRPTPETIGLWCERAQVHHLSCLILPGRVSGARLLRLARQRDDGLCIPRAGRRGRTPWDRRHCRQFGDRTRARGPGATARCAGDRPRPLGVRARRTRTARLGARPRHAGSGFRPAFRRSGAAARGDGRIRRPRRRNRRPPRAARSPRRDVLVYGFLGGPAPISLPTVLFMTNNLVMRRFSNFESATVKDPARLNAALRDLQETIGDLRFHTRIGREFFLRRDRTGDGLRDRAGSQGGAGGVRFRTPEDEAEVRQYCSILTHERRRRAPRSGLPNPFGVQVDVDVSRLITVVETAGYLRMTAGLLDDAERTAVVNRIAADPRTGDLIKDTGGLRKVRVALKGQGKRGGGRLITYFHDEDMPVFLVAFYAKNTQSNLNAVQRKAAEALTDAICRQYRSRER